MNMQSLFAAAALTAGLCAPVAAATFEGSTTQGATVVTDYAGVGLISFDIDFANFSAASVEYRIDAVDGGAPIDFNAVLRNYTGLGFAGYSITLSQGTFSFIGSVDRQFGGTSSVSLDGATATVSFDTPEYLDVELGNALGTTPAAADWTIGGLAVGDRVTLTLQPLPVPEPGSYALLLAGLAGVLLKARRARGA